MRPVSTRPAAKPAKTRRLMKARRRATSTDVDAARHAAGRLGYGHREHAVAELRGDVVGTHGTGQREAAMERAMAALHAVVPLARDIGLASRALQRELSVVKPDVDVLAQEARQLGRDDEGVRGLVEIDRRRPASRFDAREPLHAFLEGEQVAQRIPARESHQENRSMFEEFAGSVVLSQGSAPAGYRNQWPRFRRPSCARACCSSWTRTCSARSMYSTSRPATSAA